MRVRCGAVKTDRQPHQSALLEIEDGLPNEQRRYAGRLCRVHSVLRCILNDGKKVRALERISAGEHELRHVHLRNLVDEVERLGGREFQRMAVRARIHATVYALQIASLGRFPYHYRWTLIQMTQLEAHGFVRADLHRLGRGLAAATEATVLIASKRA